MGEQDWLLEAERKAEDFCRNEKQFQLGFLPTESPHPETGGLETACKKSFRSGIELIGRVDRGDIPPKAREVFSSEEFALLMNSLKKSLQGGGRIFFSGCGATGRLAILLEASWRGACLRCPGAAKFRNRVSSLMTGGDYALVRSVESFEDYASFGRRQARDAGISGKDTFIAVSEGGETSSVIGSALFAAARGADVYFAFNNPGDLLAENIERSREAIEHPGIVPLELCTGPMALTGSTRMQAVTVELLVLGRALEEAFRDFAGTGTGGGDPVDIFEALASDIYSAEGAGAISSFLDFETGVYSKNGLMTYFADSILLDIFTDTAERAPTFMLPPFVKNGDFTSPRSWSFVKNPLYPTEEAWRRVLLRKPRCLEWTEKDYRDMGAPRRITDSPPGIGLDELYKFRIGNEESAGRFAAGGSSAAAILSSLDADAGEDRFLSAFRAVSSGWPDRKILFIGSPGRVKADFTVACDTGESPVMLWEHLAAKLVMNTVSTVAMAALGRVKENWMSWVEATNKKLIDRSTRLISEICGLSYNEACRELFISICRIESEDWAGKERPSPVQDAIRRLGKG